MKISNWSYAQTIFLDGFTTQGFLIRILQFWLGWAIPSLKVRFQVLNPTTKNGKVTVTTSKLPCFWQKGLLINSLLCNKKYFSSNAFNEVKNSTNFSPPFCFWEGRGVYDNEYTSIIDAYFYDYFHWFKSWALVLQNILDTLSDILNKCLRFSLIKIESVSITQAKPRLMPTSQSVEYTFLLKCYL